MPRDQLLRGWSAVSDKAVVLLLLLPGVRSNRRREPHLRVITCRGTISDRNSSRRAGSLRNRSSSSCSTCCTCVVCSSGRGRGRRAMSRRRSSSSSITQSSCCSSPWPSHCLRTAVYSVFQPPGHVSLDPLRWQMGQIISLPGQARNNQAAHLAMPFAILFK